MEYKVFISSTYLDLQEYRAMAIEVVNRYKCQPVAMEHFMAQPEESKKVCENEIKQCDIFVGIYAHRYGFIPEGEDQSITQLEYELAKTLGKDCLCFIIDKDHPWLPQWMEWESYSKLTHFLSEVKNEKTAAFFTTPADFSGRFSTSLGVLILNKKTSPWGRTLESSNKTWIPLTRFPSILPAETQKWQCCPTGSTTIWNRYWYWTPSAAWGRAP